MRIVIFSDSHGNLHRAEEIIKTNRQEAEAFIFLGDGLREVLSLREKYSDLSIFYVRGNCDFGGVIPSAQNSEARSFGPVKIFYTHGDRYGVKEDTDNLLKAGKEAGARVVLYGHTHVPDLSFMDGIYVLNPGSCSLSRSGPPSYMVLDITGNGIVPVLRRLS